MGGVVSVVRTLKSADDETTRAECGTISDESLYTLRENKNPTTYDKNAHHDLQHFHRPPARTDSGDSNESIHSRSLSSGSDRSVLFHQGTAAGDSDDMSQFQYSIDPSQFQPPTSKNNVPNPPVGVPTWTPNMTAECCTIGDESLYTSNKSGSARSILFHEGTGLDDASQFQYSIDFSQSQPPRTENNAPDPPTGVLVSTPDMTAECFTISEESLYTTTKRNAQRDWEEAQRQLTLDCKPKMRMAERDNSIPSLIGGRPNNVGVSKMNTGISMISMFSFDPTEEESYEGTETAASGAHTQEEGGIHAIQGVTLYPDPRPSSKHSKKHSKNTKKHFIKRFLKVLFTSEKQKELTREDIPHKPMARQLDPVKKPAGKLWDGSEVSNQKKPTKSPHHPRKNKASAAPSTRRPRTMSTPNPAKIAPQDSLWTRKQARARGIPAAKVRVPLEPRGEYHWRPALARVVEC